MLAGDKVGKIFRHSPNIIRNGHLIVVEDDDNLISEVADLV